MTSAASAAATTAAVQTVQVYLTAAQNLTGVASVTAITPAVITTVMVIAREQRLLITVVFVPVVILV
jgi:hypothetical protein